MLEAGFLNGIVVDKFVTEIQHGEPILSAKLSAVGIKNGVYQCKK